MENLEKHSITMKQETTEDILKSLDNCYGVTFFRIKLKYTLKNAELEKNKLYIIDDENKIDRKFETIIKKNQACVYVWKSWYRKINSGKNNR